MMKDASFSSKWFEDWRKGGVKSHKTKSHFNSFSTEMKIAEFAHGVDLNEVAHNEPPHLDLHCLPSTL